MTPYKFATKYKLSEKLYKATLILGDDPFFGVGWDAIAKAIKKNMIDAQSVFACMYAYGYHWSIKRREWVSPLHGNAVVRRVFRAAQKIALEEVFSENAD